MASSAAFLSCVRPATSGRDRPLCWSSHCPTAGSSRYGPSSCRYSVPVATGRLWDGAGGARSRQSPSLGHRPGPADSWPDGSRRVLGHAPNRLRPVAAPGVTEASKSWLAVDSYCTATPASYAGDWASHRPKYIRVCLQSAARHLWYRRLGGAVVVCRYGSTRTDTVVHRHPETQAATAATRSVFSQSLPKNHGGGLSTCCSSASPKYTLSPIKSNTC